jgi:hypothetical protein
VVIDRGVESLQWLNKGGWFQWSSRRRGMHRVVSRIMEEQLTTAMGRYYRACSNHEKERYIEQVEDMVGSDDRLVRTTALYMIYHTNPKTRLEQKLDDVRLWKALQALHQGGDVKEIVDGHLQGFFEHQEKLFGDVP